MGIGKRQIAGLLTSALISEAVYLTAAVCVPWWRYGGRLRSWHELLGPGWGPPAACAAALALLFGAYFWGWRIVRRAGAGAETQRVLWGGAVVFAATLFWVLPITSDLFTYLVQAHLLTDWHVNPFVYSPLDLGGDLLVLAYPAVYNASPSVYGPAWALLSSPATLGARDVTCGLLYLNGLAALAFLGCAWLLERIVQEMGSQAHGLLTRQEGLYLFAWNPLVLWMSVGDGHNDIVMMFFGLLGLWCLVRERWGAAFGFLALSVWIKYVSLALAPLFLGYMWRRLAERGRAGHLALTRAFLVMAAVTLAVYLPYLLLDGPPGPLAGPSPERSASSWTRETVQRLLQPSNWEDGGQRQSGRMLVAGGMLFGAAYLLALCRSWGEWGSLGRILDLSFVVALLAFVLGAARSQPWHLVWPAALAGLSGRRWAWPVVAGLSAAMMGVQVWVEWGAPGWELIS